MDVVIQRRSVDVRAVRTPAHPRHWTSDFEDGDWLFSTLVASLPDPHRSVVTPGGDEFNASATSKCSVKRVDDFTMGTKTTDASARGEVCVCESVVCGDGIEEG